jgi:hypothetical protein
MTVLALLGNVEIFVCGRGRRRVGLALFAGGRSITLTPVIALTVAALAVATVVLTITHVLHLAIAIDGAPGPVAVAAVVVTLATVILARRASAVTTR